MSWVILVEAIGEMSIHTVDGQSPLRTSWDERSSINIEINDLQTVCRSLFIHSIVKRNQLILRGLTFICSIFDIFMVRSFSTTLTLTGWIACCAAAKGVEPKGDPHTRAHDHASYVGMC